MDSPFKADILKGKVALVTGGGSGIGFEITRQLGLHGAKIVISGRREKVLQAAVAELSGQDISIQYVQGDVRSYDSCEKMVAEAAQHFGRLDILVNCAAGNFLSPAEQLSSNGFRTVIDIDTIGTFNMSRAAFAELKKSGDAIIINISMTLHYGATWYQAHASAAKSAVDSLTRSLALEWGSYGIRVVGVAPGPIKGTPGMTKLAPGEAERMEALSASQVPLGHMGEKWDIAMGCVFLTSRAAKYVSGTTLVVDGAEWLYKRPVVPRETVAQMARAVESKSRAVGIAGAAAKSKL
ncbi:hypothetical protein N2152v2_000350 [Parachlorella kessleri]